LRSCIGKDCLSLDLEDDFELYRHPKGQTRDTDNEPNRYFLAAEYIAKEIRDRVRHPGLIKEVSGGSDEYADAHYAHHLVERSQVLFCSGQSAESGGVGGIPSSLYVEFFAEAAEILRLVIDNRKHAAEKEQVSGLHGLNVGAKGRRGSRELNAELL
jgi:hypothetical protein